MEKEDIVDKSAIKGFAIWARAELKKAIAQNARETNSDFLIEEKAYRWFAHFIAQRFIEINGYDATISDIFPELQDMQELEDIPSEVKDSILGKSMEIPKKDWKRVQIIGWLYQGYNSEIKSRVFAELKDKKKITKEEIPAATQLFTPDWIVKYMVENSVGRVWSDTHRRSGLKKRWKYFLDDGKQSPKVEKTLRAMFKEKQGINPEEIRCIDPCVGTGHILCYLFDILMEIYTSCGYEKERAVKLIIEKNICGLDIDERAAKLAWFSILMKGLEYDKNLLSREILKPRIYPVKSSRFLEKNGQDFLNSFIGEDKNLRLNVDLLLEKLRGGDEYGSIIEIRGVDFKKIRKRLDEFKEFPQMKKELETLCEIGNLLSSTYDVVVTNPPYMGSLGMNEKLGRFVKENYPDSKYDLYGVFIERCKKMTAPGGYLAMITQHSWMFITSFEKLREKIQNIDIVNMAHLGSRAFEDIEGAVVQTVAFVFRNSYIGGYRGTYVRVVDGINQKEKEEIFLSGANRYVRVQEDFRKIPGMPVAYWTGENLIEDFEKGEILDSVMDVKVGIQTGNNDKFIRLWHEVDRDTCSFHSENLTEFLKSGKKWVPYNKGGQYRKWYGNYDYVVNWENNGEEIKNFKDSRGNQRSVIRSPEYQFRECITWGLISAVGFSMRYRGCGGINDVSGMSAYGSGDVDPSYILGLMNTPVAEYIFSILNPTINVQVGDFKNFPVLRVDEKTESEIKEIVKENIELSKIDWDMNEISWDFKSSPLVRGRKRISDSYREYKEEVNKRFTHIAANEEKLAKLFIELYGLEKELDICVPDRNITVARIFDQDFDVPYDMRGNRFVMTRSDVVKNFVSYAVGCILGRYPSEIGSTRIIPITDRKYFEEDIVTKFIEFVTLVFGKEYLEENLKFIGENLRGRGHYLKRIRDYFLCDFYKDHCKMYQKRPIYWQVDSGKKKGLKALIYIHNWDENWAWKVKEDYAKSIKKRYEAEIIALKDAEDEACKRRVKILEERISEIELFVEKLEKIIELSPKLDIDDGVKENYKRFETVLAKL